MASVAELEAGLVSERTKAALAAAKARGVTWEIRMVHVRSVVSRRQQRARGSDQTEREHASNLRSILEDIRAQGITSIRKIADEMNRRGILAPRGGEWRPTTVVRLLSRI
jgi:DNA invertase Pin-like site-specific DNA recombinase